MITPVRRALTRLGRSGAAIAVVGLAALVLLASASASPADPDSGDAVSPPEPAHGDDADSVGADRPRAESTLRLDPRRNVAGGRIPAHFVGLSIEWSLIERYMNPGARPGFMNLLRNLGSGTLRIGGGSQDLMPFDPDATNTERVITPEDVRAVRETLDGANADDAGGAPSWGAILGTAMAPPNASRPWVGPDHARTFATHGVAPAFDGAERTVAGIELGNEPDLSYRSNAARYLSDLTIFSPVTRPFAFIAPNTSETIAPWQSIEARTVPTRFFWDWHSILDAAAPAMTAEPGSFGAFATDHFYPMARNCSTDAYRCATIPRLLSDERMANLDYEVYIHATEAARHGLGYRLEEINSAAGRGVDGVSNVAASAVWALDAMFNAACPQPPHEPAANTDCHTGAIGVNFHNAEVGAFFAPEAGNAYYNAIAYDPTPTAGSPAATPEYYAMLLFARFAQGTEALRPVPVATDQPDVATLKAWQVDAGASERRLFLINKGDSPVSLTVEAPAASVAVHRMTPKDPAGLGRTIDAPAMQIDGRQISTDGSWPGFEPATEAIAGDRFRITVGAAEAAVVTLHGHDE